MTTFDDRKKALENKFFHDSELAFKINARCRKLLGIWAAQHLHIEEKESLDYALELVQLTGEASKPGAIIERIMNDFITAGIDITPEHISEKMEELFDVAKHQVTKETEND